MFFIFEKLVLEVTQTAKNTGLLNAKAVFVWLFLSRNSSVRMLRKNNDTNVKYHTCVVL